MAEVVKVQVQAETKSAEDALRKAQQLADSLGKKQTTIRIKAEGIDGLAKQIRVVENETAKLALSADTFRALKSGAITAAQAMEDMGAKVNRVNTDMQSFIDHATGVSRETSQITAKTSMFGKVSDDTFKSYTSGAMSGADATQTLQKGMSGLGNETQKTSGIFDSLTKRFTAANLISAAVTRGITLLRNALREAVTEMKEMDKELTTIKMVTGASDSDIAALRQNAFSGALANGRSVTDYLTASERFARAGYRENIEQLTQLSLTTQNVGGVTEDVASKFILAADAAWKLGGSSEALTAILDGMTAVSDKNATDIGKLAEGMTVAGSAFANAGESAQTYTALMGTVTAATQRSGSEVARGLQTILFRVRQVKGELDDGEMIDADDISNAAKALDSVGISVLNDSNELKSFSEIMSELNGKWDTLNSKQKAYLQNALAGNRRGNILFALMDNYDVYMKQLEEYEKATGTAAQKNETYTQSWEAATNDLNTAWTQLVSTITSAGSPLQQFTRSATDFLKWSNEQIQKDRERRKTNHIPEADTEAGANYRGRRLTEYWKSRLEMEKMDETQSELSESSIQIIKVFESEAEAVDKLSDAFTKSEDAIKAASDAMKKDKDDAVKSARDIFNAMSDAESKGYYGSNAYKEGAKLFFGTTDKKAIKEESKKALETYFEGIKEGDYSNAAATLWGSISDENGEIVDASGEVIASMKDMGDSYKWTFDKAHQGTEQFLQSMQESTGISAEFWASLISSLGMYSDEMDSWIEEHADTEMTYKVTADTDQAKTAIDQIQALLDGIKDKTVKVNIIQTINGMSASSALDYTKQTANKYSFYSGLINADGYRPSASGKHDSYSGIALVNDEFPADGSKPELIISKSTGRAFIANGGRPAFVNLRPDDIVLSAKETRSAMGVPTFADGTDNSWITDPVGAIAAMINGVLAGDSLTTPKEDGEGEEESKKKKKKKPDADKTWAELKKLIEYLLDKANDDLKEQLQILDDMLEEMENSRKAAQDAKKLEEKQTAAQEALLDLERAQTERTVRYYNEETQQWEWMADQGSVQQAQEAYNEALDSLKEYEEDLAYEARKAEIEAQKDALQEQYDAMKDSWDDIVDAIEAPAGDLQQLLNTLSQYGTSTMIEQSGGIADLLNKLRDGLFGSGYGLGIGNINANTNGSTTTTSTVFDDGGFAYGAGMMRKGAGAETVIGPGLTRAILNPVKNERFSSFVDSLRYLVDGGNGAYSFRNRSSITNNNGGNYYVNGVRVGSDMAQRPFAEVMKTIAIHANESL